MVKNFKNIFLWNQEADDFETWYTASGTQVLTIFHMMILGWPWLFLWQGQICFWMLLHGWKLIQHWVLMYFQVCSNSTYPQHSGERYRTNGPLVYQIFFKLAGNQNRHKTSVKFVFQPDRSTPYRVRCPWVSEKFPIDLQWENGVAKWAHSFLIRSSSNLLVTRTGIKSQTSSNSGQVGTVT